VIVVGRRRATLRLLFECDNACVFCAQAGLSSKPIAEEEFTRAIDEARTNADAITFVGGEPALDPSLVDRVAAARAKGFTRIGVQTNGRALADASLSASLARAGLTDAHLSIHGADAAVHDYHTGIEGSLQAALAAAAALRANGVTVVVATVVTRSNFRNLTPLARLLGARGVAAWLLEFPRVAGRAASAFDRVVPRLGLAVPFALHAMEAARAAGVDAWIRGVPLCLLGPFASRALRAPTEEEVDIEGRAFAATCERCDARASCEGVEADYLERFGDGELAAREAIERNDREHRDDLRALFVGVGERVKEPSRALAPPPSRARDLLPILGKVRPAHTEVPAGTERKSGEALREIFPGLFERPKGS
jgi:molybdenum cofactor biosynthesis enzyme MoaA